MEYLLCPKCKKEVYRFKGVCQTCNEDITQTGIVFSNYSFDINAIEIMGLYAIKKRLEKLHPEYEYTIEKTCKSYTTLCFNGLGMIRFEHLSSSNELYFRLSEEMKEKHIEDNKIDKYTKNDGFWGIIFEDNNLSRFNDFIEDTINYYKRLVELDNNRKK